MDGDDERRGPGVAEQELAAVQWDVERQRTRFESRAARDEDRSRVAVQVVAFVLPLVLAWTAFPDVVEDVIRRLLSGGR